MFFFFRKSTVVLDCFTDNNYLHDFLPIDYGHKFYPDWWKQLPKDFVSKKSPTQLKLNTMKSCRGLISYYQNSAVIPLWSDYNIKIGSLKTPKVMFESASQYKGVFHEPEQWGNYLPSTKYGHLKLDCPWFIREKEGIQFSFSQPFYNNLNPTEYLFCPGIVDYKYQNSGNLNIMFDFRDDERIIELRAGEPAAMIIPLTERTLKIKTHLVSPQELNNMNPKPITFNHHYQFVKKAMDKKEAKCPFGFGK